MKVSHIKISQVLGIEDFEVKPGAVTVLRGKNAAGKSSVLKGVKAALQGGSDAHLLRNGADKGEIVIVFDNNYIVERKLNQKGSTLKVVHPEFGPLSKPQAILDGLLDVLSVNPVAFMTMPAKDRAKYLLDVCPIEVSNDEIRAAVNYGDMPIPTFPEEMNGLDRIAKTRAAIYEQRTSTNGAVKDKRATIKTLGDSLPANRSELEIDYDAEIAKVDVALDAAHKELIDAHERASSTLRSAIAHQSTASEAESRAWTEKYSASRAELIEQREKLDDAIHALDVENEKIIADNDRRVHEAIAVADAAMLEEKTAANAAIEPKIMELKEKRAGLVARSQDIAKLRNVAKTVGSFETQAENLEATSKKLTAAIEGLDALRLDLLNRLPLPGIEIRDGEVFVDGVAYDDVNRARQVDVAVELAKLRVGELKLICVDNAECLDSESFDALCEKALRDDIQLICTRVTDSALTIETTDAAATEDMVAPTNEAEVAA